MQRLPDLAERLRQEWQGNSTGLVKEPHVLRPGASPEELAQFERRCGMVFPPEFRTYLSTIDGMAEFDTDDEMTSWWGLDRIKPIGEHYAYVSSHPDSQRDFVICDIIMDCCWYAIRLRGEAPELGEVLLWADERPVVVARSFTEFLETYLADPGSLL